MKSKIGFIAVGQAGGNIGFLFEKSGYPVLYINTSEEDLGTLKEAKYKHHIKGGEGCNKDRMKAKQLIMEDFKVISRKVNDSLSCEFLYIIFASGGGTGSGAGPMLADLMVGEFEDSGSQTSVGIITILPALNESLKANINSYECFNELTQIEGLSSTIILDNDRLDKMALNHKFVKSFCSFLDIPIKHKSERGNIDKAEIIETLRARGMLQVTETPVQGSSTATVADSFRKGIYATLEDDGVIKYISISTAGNINIEQFQADIGVPIDIFRTYNEKSTICCLSGLSFPTTRLNLVYDKINDNKERITKVMQEPTNQMKNISFLDNIQTTSQPLRNRRSTSASSGNGSSRRDIMNKYLGK